MFDILSLIGFELSQAIDVLKQNGFVELRQVGSHLRMENPKTGCQTTVPMHNKELGKGLEQAILRQAGLKNQKGDNSNENGKVSGNF